MITTVIINTNTPVGKKLLEQVKKYPGVARIVEDRSDDLNRRYSYQEFKEKLASSLNDKFNADIDV